MERELRILLTQKQRMNRETWDYLNQNDPDYAKMPLYEIDKSVNDVREEIKDNLGRRTNGK